MNATDQRIEIFAPFGEAVELTKKILFQPFDLGKWFVIGLSAWLATFFGGGGFSYRHSWKSDDFHWYFRSSHSHWQHIPVWMYPLMLIGFVVFLALVILLLWLNARGRFMFIDCIVRNRGAVAEPWREYRREADSFFLFRLLILLGMGMAIGVVAICCLPFAHAGARIILLPIFFVFFAVWLVIAILLGLTISLMVPVMYRRRCRASEAFGAAWDLIVQRPGIFILYILFFIVIAIAALIISCLAGCVTCCLAAVPYLGTVILLPVVMTLFAFPLCFLRQFGDSYDVWAVVRPVEAATILPPPEPPVPPVQDAPPM